MVSAANELHAKYQDVHIYISQLPPRNDEFGPSVTDLNGLIKNNTPINIHVILNENIVKEDLFDAKHIRKNKLGKLVTNMTSAMRKVTDLNRNNRPRVEADGQAPNRLTRNDNTNNYNSSPSYVAARTVNPLNNTSHVNNSNSSSSSRDEVQTNGFQQSIVTKILQAMEHSNKLMMSNMASNMQNILGGLPV